MRIAKRQNQPLLCSHSPPNPVALYLSDGEQVLAE